MLPYQRIVVKVGTNVLTREDGLLDITNISQLTDQLAELKKTGLEVILVSSGAVGAGRAILSVPPGLNKVVRRQILSSVGQVRLMETYRQLLANHGLLCGQVLATKEDFRDRQHYLNMQNCFQALLRDRIVPIVNENDVVAVTELMFTDNDELAGLVAAMINADALIILSSVDGVLDGPLDDPATRVIPEIDCTLPDTLRFIQPARSSGGRGGMQTKFRIARKAASVGIDTYIANGRRAGILPAILSGQYVGTLFRGGEALSNLKRWLAYNEPDHAGDVYINAGAEAILSAARKASSLLPVGIVRITGNFQKGDLLRIYSEDQRPLGMGIAQYSADMARGYMGQQGKKALVHYDYLYIQGE